ncbi:MAG: hypothetical protein JST00_28040 [Deltaproteobacteria bacterium]|nr:hypothetical protein [Deltaproteobacteria bacterium]
MNVRSRAHVRLLLVSTLGLAALGSALVAACSDSGGTTPGTDGGGGGTDGTTPGEDGSTPGTDGGTDSATDGGADAGKDVTTRDANGPGEAGADCTFNYDCQLALRCECDEATGCACAPGARGTGRNGVDTCDSGNQCVSSVCVEGPGDGGTFYCSDECKDDTECTGKLPLCTNVAFVGKICIRTP